MCSMNKRICQHFGPEPHTAVVVATAVCCYKRVPYYHPWIFPGSSEGPNLNRHGARCFNINGTGHCVDWWYHLPQ